MNRYDEFIEEAFARAGLRMEVSGWGYAQSRTIDDRIVRVRQDDATIVIMEMTSNELIISELKVSGYMTAPPALAALLVAVTLR